MVFQQHAHGLIDRGQSVQFISFVYWQIESNVTYEHSQLANQAFLILMSHIYASTFTHTQTHIQIGVTMNLNFCKLN